MSQGLFWGPIWAVSGPPKREKGKNGSNVKESGPSSEISDLSSVDNTGLGYRDHTQGLSPTPSEPLFLRQFCRMLLQLRLYCKNGIANVNLRWPTLITRVPFHTKGKKKREFFLLFQAVKWISHVTDIFKLLRTYVSHDLES